MVGEAFLVEKVGNDVMNPELRDACTTAIQQADEPMTVAKIATAVLGRDKPSANLTKALDDLSASALIHEWPTYRSTRNFWNRPFRSALEDAFIAALDEGPLTVPKAAKPVSKLLRRVSEITSLSELRGVAPRLAVENRIAQVAVNRQSIIYFSYGYLGRLMPERASATSIEGMVLETVKRLQSGPGDLVRIDHLRNTPELRGVLDNAAIQLSNHGTLILTRYGGARPVPDEEKWKYIEDNQGNLFIGIALPHTVSE